MAKMGCANSAALFERARRILPGGVSRNTLLHGDHPLYADHASGCRIVDVDGVERIDFANNMAAHIHGHAFAPIVQAVSDQLKRGTAFTMGTEAEVVFAEHLCARVPGFDKIRFVNSGTEAVMTGLKAARAFTGRPKIAKAEGAYHGAYDYAEVSQAPKPDNWGRADQPAPVPLAQGTPSAVVEDVVIIPFNDPEIAIALLDAHKDEIACILIDPMPHRIGLIPVKDDFIAALRRWSEDNGALLMFDEVITFRNEFSGMQARFDAVPDLTAMGKMIGGGFPVGALAGRGDVMDVFTRGDKGLRLPHSGTFSANPVTMTAGLTAMEYFDNEAAASLNRLGDYARGQLTEVIKAARVPACVTGSGSLLRLHLKARAPRNYREAYPSAAEQGAMSKLIETLYNDGIMMIHTGAAALSTPMGHEEIDRLADAVFKGLVSLKPALSEM